MGAAMIVPTQMRGQPLTHLGQIIEPLPIEQLLAEIRVEDLDFAVPFLVLGYDLAEMRRRLAAHLSWYNHGRTHHALGGLLVPADRYYGRAQEVLARIEAGAGRDTTDLLDLRERCLELFKVTSRDGVPEVWLLGQKLLGAASTHAQK